MDIADNGQQPLMWTNDDLGVWGMAEIGLRGMNWSKDQPMLLLLLWYIDFLGG